MSKLIRDAIKADYPDILKIYNEAVLNTTATFDLRPQSMQDKAQWFADHENQYPLVSAIADQQVVGWACLSPWSPRKGYQHTVELSLYVNSAYQQQGFGTQLMAAILEKGHPLNAKTIMAQIAGDNDHSVYLHRKFGFEEIGVLKQVGFKFNQWLDVTLMQKLLD